MGTLDIAKAEVDSELRFGQIFKKRKSVGVYFSAALKTPPPKVSGHCTPSRSSRPTILPCGPLQSAL